MTYFAKDCDCKSVGCTIGSIRITDKIEIDKIVFTMTISPYSCHVCGKAWKLVKKPDDPSTAN